MNNMDLFDYAEKGLDETSRPLAERMRPTSLEEFVGQGHLLEKGGLLRHALEQDRLFSMIFWGPPGSGKTTLARIIARVSRSHFETFSAVLSGVKEIRQVIERARTERRYYRKKTVLFVDELHRFNKAQQDAFLPHVERGLITLVGATTENPSFEVIAPLLSRARVLVLKPFSEGELTTILQRAIADKERGLGAWSVQVDPDAMAWMVRAADGDARAALNCLEAGASLVRDKAPEDRRITRAVVEKVLQRKMLRYDKAGDQHYDLISALHKSLRGSDPDAAMYWVGRMLAAGEDPLYIARRMVRFASEDIGNADPQALTVAVSAMQAFQFVGPPEGDLALIQAAVYLATAPKSNALYTGYAKVQQAIRETGTLAVPLHIRNAPTKLMKAMGYGKGYRYAHDFNNAYVPQQYLPEPLANKRFYSPSDRGYEKIVRKRLAGWEKQKGSEAAPGDDNGLSERPDRKG
ncbi:MAG: replication-associated recombination protein A [Deltaproteobacteria bacterium]|nr:replication-associated recombination protein A [Deltaproteobacteria bacterium]